MSHRWPMNLLRTRRSAGIGVVAALVAGALAFAFGTGYVTNKAVFTGSSAWVGEGEDAVLVSAGGGTPQARVADPGTGDIVTGPDGTMVFTTPGEDGAKTKVERFDPDTTGAAARTVSGGDGTEVAANEAGTWLVDPEQDTVVALDPDTWAPRGEPVPIDDGIAAHALGTDGSLWVLDGTGAVRRVDGEGVGRPRSVGLDDAEGAVLVVVGDQPVVLDPGAGRLAVVDGDTYDVAALRGATVLAQPEQPGPWLVAALVGDGQRTLLAWRSGEGEPSTAPLGDDPVAAPVAIGTEAYVPTVRDGRQELRHLTLPALDEVDPVALPATDRDTDVVPDDGDLGYETFLVGTRVWANDPAAAQALTIGEDLEPRPIDKVVPEAEGTGDDPDEADPEAEADVPPIAQPLPTPLPDLPPAPSTPTPAPGGGAGGTTAPLPGTGGTGGPGSGTGTTPPPGQDPPPLSNPTTLVPDVVGMDQDAACEALATAQLACARNGVADQDRTEDEVYEQSVEDGERVDARSTVTVTFAVWGDVEVPDVTGLSPQLAIDRLTEVGLTVDPAPTERTDAAPDTPMNQVIVDSLTEAIGTEVKVNTAITFDWYSAYTPLPYDPNLGLNQASEVACDQLRTQGFQSCSVAVGEAAPNGTSANVTYAASPAEAGPLDPFAPIVLTFYGSRIELATPAFPGGCTEATGWATANGIANFTCTPVTNSPRPVNGAPVGAVISQDPPPGTVMGSGDTLTINSYEPTRVDVPDWYRMGTNGIPSANHVLTTGSPQADGLRGTWTYSSSFGFLAEAEPNSTQMTCWVFDDGTQQPECHPGAGQPDATLAPSGGNTWVPYGTGVPLFAWTVDPGPGGRTRAIQSCRLIRDGTDYLGQYWSSGLDAESGDWCVLANGEAAGGNSDWIPGEVIYVLV